MRPVDTSARHRAICIEAADWLVRLQAGELSQIEQAHYWRWLRRSPVHVAETLRLLQLRARLSALAPIGMGAQQRYSATTPATNQRPC